MEILRFSDNLIQLRHKKRITQEQLAEYIGVTKASVSKWETKQSLPDIMLLPGLAAFFDVTIDELLGYEPQLSREQIQKIYHNLAKDFSQMPFETVMEKSRTLVKKYYSCYPFLFQICILWLNHFMLAEVPQQPTVLNSIAKLCNHILESCTDISICNNTVILKTYVDLQLGKTTEVIAVLEEMINPTRLSAQSDQVLIQAYQMTGEAEKADSFTQISMYSHLLALFASAIMYLTLHSADLNRCEETIQRLTHVASAYRLDSLHPNTMANLHYQAALIYCLHGKEQEALEMLERYGSNIQNLFTGENILLHGDDYFDHIEPWIASLDLGGSAPRNQKTILESVIQSLEHPALLALAEKPEFHKLKRSIKEKLDEQYGKTH